jgi:hypothetical protein
VELRTAKLPFQPDELSPADYSRYQEMAGRYSHDDLLQAIAEPGWSSLDGEA